MTTALLTRGFLRDYVRNRTNLVFLVLVPLVFVTVAADTIADYARLLGGRAGSTGIESVTPGWAAAFLAATGMYFQVSTARETDRRLVLSGLPRAQLVGARMAAGAVLGALAAAAALAAVAVPAGMDRPERAIAGTAMFALIYLALGAVVGATVRDAVTGTVLLLFVWIIDVFFGPTLTSSDSVLTRFLPTHFVSLWVVDLPARHDGPSPLSWALLWTVAAFVVSFAVVVKMTSTGRPAVRHTVGSGWGQLRAGLRMSWRDWRRTPVLWILLAVVPAVFIWLADVVTPSGRTTVVVREGGAEFSQIFDPALLHAATMAPIAVGALAALAGLFIVIDARSADRRLVLAGQRLAVVLVTRVGMVLFAAGLATAASLAVTAALFTPEQWLPFVGALVLIGASYGLLGVLLGPLVGRVAGTFVAFLIPFLDLGIGQTPMLQDEPPLWARYLPGYGGMRMLVDGALTAGFDELGALTTALAWVAGLAVAAVVLFRRTAGRAGSSMKASNHGSHRAT